jgi:hypothetical protein
LASLFFFFVLNRAQDKILRLMAGQSCRSALTSWAARQRRPTKDMEIFVLRPRLDTVENQLHRRGVLR